MTEVYEVFARRLRADPIRHIGSVEAETPDLGRVYARTMYDEEAWIEMWIVARSNLVPVIELRKGT